MSVKFSQFNNEPLLLITDKVVGLHGVVNAQFPIIGIGDSFAKKIITWTQAPGSNANWIDFLNANTGTAPLISAQGTDPDVNLALGAKGLGHVFFAGTGAVGVPFGTTVQQPIGFLGGLRYNTTTNFVEYWDAGINAWVDVISGAALADATYITKLDETAQLPNSQPLSLQPSGFLSSLTGTGVITNRLMSTANVGRITIANPDGVLGNPTWDLATTGVTPGSYTNAALTVDAYGRLTAVASGSVGVLSVTGTPNQINSTLGANPILTLSSTMLAPGTVAITSLTANTAVISGAGKILTSVPLADGQILIGSSTGAPAAAALTAGTGITIVPGANSITINAAATGTGASLTKTITQIAHGFSVGQLVYLNGTVYTLALATSVVTAEVVGIITSIIDANNFVLTTSGYITGFGGLVAGSVFFVSDTTPGLLTTVAPTAVGSVQKPVFVADTTTSGYFINYRGDIITTPTSGVTSITAGSNLTGGTITSTGTIALNNVVTGLTSLEVGLLTLSGGSINSTGAIQLFPAPASTGINLAGNTIISGGAFLGIYNATNTFFSTFSNNVATANANYSLPPALPAVSGAALTSNTSGAMTWSTITFNGSVIQSSSIINVVTTATVFSGSLVVGGGNLLQLYNVASTFKTSFAATAQTSDATYTLPPGLPAVNGSVLTSNTAGNMTWGAPSGTGGFGGQQVFTASGTYTKPAGLSRIRVTVTGGGGSGAGASATVANFGTGSGAGAGGTSILVIAAASLGATESVVVGAGGAAVTGNSGNAGGSSGFGAFCAATGGAGGLANGNSANGFSSGGLGGVGSGAGAINLAGGGGGSCDHASAATVSISGMGGTSYWGGGGAGVTLGNDGVAGGNYGAGGSAASNNASSAARPGGVGGGGIVVIEEFF